MHNDLSRLRPSISCVDDGILGQVALGYSPFIDRQRAVTATRLTVVPLEPDAVLDIGQLLAEVGHVWPADGALVSLNIASESLLHELLLVRPPANLMIEVPAFMAADPANTAALNAVHAGGTTLMLKGRPLKELPREVLPCFKYSIIDLADDRRINQPAPVAGVARSIPHVQSGVRTVVDMEACFARGAHAVLGWPIDDAVVASVVRSGSARLQPAMQVLVELIRQLESEASPDQLEATLKRDPTLASKLLRYINLPASGLRVEVSSFRHAILVLGYQKLKRWLALLLVTATNDVNLRPVTFAAVRRGLLMEELARGSGDESFRDEMFICGVFSLLDRMFQQPFAQLLEAIPVSTRVYQALAENTGPLQPYVDLVHSIEAEMPFDFMEAAEALVMSVAEINRAQLRALTLAGGFD